MFHFSFRPDSGDRLEPPSRRASAGGVLSAFWSRSTACPVPSDMQRGVISSEPDRMDEATVNNVGLTAPSEAVEAILASAVRASEDGDWEAMIGLLTDGLETHPDDPYLLCWLGLAEIEIGEDGAAYDRFKRVL